MGDEPDAPSRRRWPLILIAVFIVVAGGGVALLATGTLSVGMCDPDRVKETVDENPWMAFVAVFLGGMLTAANPCVLATIPLMIGVVGGYERTGAGRSFLFSLVFVLGLAVMFSLLGVIAGMTGSLLGDVGVFWNWFVAAVCLLMGLHLLEVFELRLPVSHKYRPPTGLVGAFLLGLLFGIVSTPCAVPILAVVLAFIAAKGSVLYGALLLAIFAMGHSVLILLAGTSVGVAQGIIESKNLTRAGNVMRKLAGAMIVLVGIWFLAQ